MLDKERNTKFDLDSETELIDLPDCNLSETRLDPLLDASLAILHANMLKKIQAFPDPTENYDMEKFLLYRYARQLEAELLTKDEAIRAQQIALHALSGRTEYITENLMKRFLDSGANIQYLRELYNITKDCTSPEDLGKALIGLYK